MHAASLLLAVSIIQSSLPWRMWREPASPNCSWPFWDIHPTTRGQFCCTIHGCISLSWSLLLHNSNLGCSSLCIAPHCAPALVNWYQNGPDERFPPSNDMGLTSPFHRHCCARSLQGFHDVALIVWSDSFAISDSSSGFIGLIAY